MKQTAGFRCEICRIRLPKGKLDAHHIIPVKQGGPTNPDNLRCLCRRCHSMFRTRIGTRYVRKHPWKSQSYRFYGKRFR